MQKSIIKAFNDASLCIATIKASNSPEPIIYDGFADYITAVSEKSQCRIGRSFLLLWFGGWWKIRDSNP